MIKLTTKAKTWDKIYDKIDAGWCRGDYWLDKEGNFTAIRKKVKSVCLMGAIIYAVRDANDHAHYESYLRLVLPEKADRSIMNFNDELATKKDVLAVVKKAKKIAMQKAKRGDIRE